MCIRIEFEVPNQLNRKVAHIVAHQVKHAENGYKRSDAFYSLEDSDHAKSAYFFDG